MLPEDSSAPDFTLPGTDGETRREYTLSEYAGNDAILLAFYSFDFSPVCAGALCSFRDAEWFTIGEGIDVLGIGADSAYAHEAFIDAYDLSFPLVSDSDGSVAEAYDILHEELEGHRRVAGRGIYAIDGDLTIRDTWESDEPYENPPVERLAASLDWTGLP